MESDGKIRSKDIGTGEVNSRALDNIRSSNYNGSHTNPEDDPGSLGWQILKSGFIVINEAIVRGTLKAATIISAIIESGSLNIGTGGSITVGDPEDPLVTLDGTGLTVGDAPVVIDSTGLQVGTDVEIDSDGLTVEGGLVSAVHVDMAEQKGTANQSLNTTPLEYTTHTFALPAWVQQVKVMCWAYAQISNSSGGNQAITVGARINDVNDGAAQQNVANGTTGSVFHLDEVTITSPGASVDISAYINVGTGTNSSNQGSVWGLVLGLRT